MQQAPSQGAQKTLAAVEKLQDDFAHGLARVFHSPPFIHRQWLRAGGKWGGGHQKIAPENSAFNRASINVSQVHYAGEKRLSSATALSTIVHPHSPLAPSLHLHVSWTELKDGASYWRIMADLNPAIVNADDRERFLSALRQASGEHFATGSQQGDKYFYIPALKRHRGVAHFYLEAYNTGVFEQDYEFARGFARQLIDCYLAILEDHANQGVTAGPEQFRKQLEYHTLYFFQVLTLDRGTTAGLMVHDENDLGILGSLPRYVDTELLASWQTKLSGDQKALLSEICAQLVVDKKVLVDDTAKKKLCTAIRTFYRAHPEAMSHLARGDLLPETGLNHR